MGLKNEVESEATIFGSAIHKALEHWYCLPEDERELTKDQGAEALTLLGSSSEECTGALESIRQFVLRGEALKQLGSDDKRSLENGVKILKAYFKHYLTDGLEVVKDAAGNPLVECPLDFIIYEDSQVQIEYFGTIDAILRNKHSGLIMVADHKTTARLGTEFYNRIKPNHQYTGYLMAAQRKLGLDTNLFLVNGIQVAKTKQEFARQVTDRTEEDFQEFTAAVVNGVRQLLEAIDSDNFPLYAPNPCSNYGSCQFLPICSSPSSLRESIIRSSFKSQE